MGVHRTKSLVSLLSLSLVAYGCLDYGLRDDAPPEVCDGSDNDRDGQVDEGFPDTDGDGLADCVDHDCDVAVGDATPVPVVEECAGENPGIVDDPWSIQVEWFYPVGPDEGVLTMPAVGHLIDTNGDGAIGDGDIPAIVFTTWEGGRLIAVLGDGSATLLDEQGFDLVGGVAIGQLDLDRPPEIVSVDAGMRAIALEPSGAVEWHSPVAVDVQGPQPLIADLDSDGLVEVVLDDVVISGADGSTIAQLEGPDITCRTPVVADLDRDGIAEIVLGNQLLSVDSAPIQIGIDSTANFSVVVNADSDPEGEILSVREMALQRFEHDGTLTQTTVLPQAWPGLPAVADFDGDLEPEIVIPMGTELMLLSLDGSVLWNIPVDDPSCCAGCSAFDFDADGRYEVVYADQSNLYIIDGRVGMQRAVFTEHSSGTLWEYPVIADVDADGHAEIVIASNSQVDTGAMGGIWVLGNDHWPAAGQTWSRHDFAIGRNSAYEDATIPSNQYWLRHNSFRARPPVDGAGRSDLTVELVDYCVASCDGGPVKVSLDVVNQGGADVAAGVDLSLWRKGADEEWVLQESRTLGAIPSGRRTPLDEFVIEGVQIDGPLLVWIDGDGSDLGSITECDESNNYLYVDIDVCG